MIRFVVKIVTCRLEFLYGNSRKKKTSNFKITCFNNVENLIFLKRKNTLIYTVTKKVENVNS